MRTGQGLDKDCKWTLWGLTSQMYKFQSTSSPPPVHSTWTDPHGVHRIIRTPPNGILMESMWTPEGLHTVQYTISYCIWLVTQPVNAVRDYMQEGICHKVWHSHNICHTSPDMAILPTTVSIWSYCMYIKTAGKFNLLHPNFQCQDSGQNLHSADWLNYI